MERYERLIAVIDAFIGTFGGALRIQTIQSLLLVQKASLLGSGIKPSELHRLTGAPLETEAGLRTWSAAEVARKLYLLRPQNQPCAGAPHPLGADTYDALHWNLFNLP